MSRNEAQTRRDLIDPVLLRLGWTNDLIKVEITPGGIDIIDGKPKKRQGRSDYLLYISSQTATRDLKELVEKFKILRREGITGSGTSYTLNDS